MTKQEKTALNMAKFIKDQSLLLLEKLNELDMDTPADMCERLHEDAETLWQVMRISSGRITAPAMPVLALFLPNGHHRRAGLSSGSSGTGTLK